MSDFKLRGAFSALVAVIGYLLNCFTEMVVVLVFLMIMDYLTGLAAAYVRKDIQSNVGLIGLLKKFGFMCLVTLAFLLDYLIANFLLTLNIHLPVQGTFGVATTIVLVGNEGVSIIENLGAIGVPIPRFLRNAFQKLKDKENKGGDDNGL